MKAFAKIVPVPLQGEDRGCRVSAALLTAGAELLFVEGTGLAPSSELSMATDSEGEKRDFSGKVDVQGRYVSALMPYKQGLTRGSTHPPESGSVLAEHQRAVGETAIGSTTLINPPTSSRQGPRKMAWVGAKMSLNEDRCLRHNHRIPCRFFCVPSLSDAMVSGRVEHRLY